MSREEIENKELNEENKKADIMLIENKEKYKNWIKGLKQAHDTCTINNPDCPGRKYLEHTTNELEELV